MGWGMGKASNRKLEARIQSAVKQTILAQIKTPFWEKNLFWGPLGIVVGIVLMVLAVMKDVRWLLFVAWPCLLLNLWVATCDISSQKRKVTVFLGLLFIFASGHWALHVWLAPDSLSNEKLCSDANEIAKRMRDFNHERQRQARQMEDEDRRRRMQAKSEEDKSRMYKEYREFLDRWDNDFRYDYENQFLPKALTLRQQLLNRLPPQPPETTFLDEATFHNIGVVGVLGASNKLEVLARMLCPQMFKENQGK